MDDGNCSSVEKLIRIAFRAADFALGLAAFGLLMFWKLPPWLVVILAAIGVKPRP